MENFTKVNDIQKDYYDLYHYSSSHLYKGTNFNNALRVCDDIFEKIYFHRYIKKEKKRNVLDWRKLETFIINKIC